MHPPPPATSSTGDRGLQPAWAVPSQWLTRFEGTAAAEHLGRLDADAALVTTLELSGFEGRDWERFARALAEYGYQVTLAWIVTGDIYRRCRARRLGGADIVAPTWAVERSDAESLANETVALAIRGFRDTVLKRGRWDRNRGATLKTFFIGQCLIRFPTAFRGWRDDHRPFAAASLDQAERLRAGDRSDPAYVVAVNDELRRAVHDAAPTDRQRAILLLDASGYADAEIAELLDMTAKAVDSFLYRYRRARKESA